MGAARRRVLVAFCALLAVLAGARPPVSAHGPVPGGTPISFRASDGVLLNGYRFGAADRVVIFSHMYGTDQRIWFPLARRLERAGYSAITYDYRGIGLSRGRFVIASTWQDAVAAIDFARARGARRLVLIGASMGGTASLMAAAHRDVDALVVMASGMVFQGLNVHPHLDALRGAKLFIVGRGDQPFATSIRTMYARVPEPKRLRVYRTRAHGTYLFGTRHGPAAEAEILRFLRTSAR